MARAFGCTTRTVRRHQRRYADGGLAALGRGAGYPRGRPRIAESRAQLVNRLKAEGASTRDIAHRLGVDEKAIRKLLRRLGWVAPTATQAELPLAPESADPNVSAPPPIAPETPADSPPGECGPKPVRIG